VLAVRDLVVQYGRIVAVRGLSFDVGAGELVALVGPNGAGKSSTLAAITGTVRRDSGVIELDGTDIGREQPEQIARRGLALVPEGRRIFGSLTVSENLVMGATTRRPGPDVAADVGNSWCASPRCVGTTAVQRDGSRAVSSRCSPSPAA
jgi:branched-chain amino acid transport system ATP-binding protein